jgi:hypothetical protein
LLFRLSSGQVANFVFDLLRPPLIFFAQTTL